MNEFIYFDCMETLIQMDIPSLEVYADWAYQGADALSLWEDPLSFQTDWFAHRDRFRETHGALREDTILDRIRDIVGERARRVGRNWEPGRIEEEARRIHDVFWARYRDASHVLPEVPEVLARLEERENLRLGVVSNFKVRGGVQELLGIHRLRSFFQVIVVSCDVGWRKPAAIIYEAAIRAAGTSPEKILFVGDNLLADYQGPRVMGMNSVLYDPAGVNDEAPDRIGSFREVEDWL